MTDGSEQRARAGEVAAPCAHVRQALRPQARARSRLPDREPRHAQWTVLRTTRQARHAGMQKCLRGMTYREPSTSKPTLQLSTCRPQPSQTLLPRPRIASPAEPKDFDRHKPRAVASCGLKGNAEHTDRDRGATRRTVGPPTHQAGRAAGSALGNRLPLNGFGPQGPTSVGSFHDPCCTAPGGGEWRCGVMYSTTVRTARSAL